MVTEFNYAQRFTKAGYKMLSRCQRPLAGLALALGLALAGTSHLLVWAADLSPTAVPQATVPVVTSASNISPISNEINETSVVATSSTSPVTGGDGIYLYGQSPEPNQVGSAYAVMEIIDNQAIGAFYMPQSSFDCFYGEVRPERLALNVLSTYEQSVYQYSLPVEANTVAAVTPSTHPMQLAGYHGIESVSSNDHRILNICRTAVEEMR